MSEKKGASQPSPENVQAVELIMERLEEFPNLILTDYHGLSVADINRLRNELRKAGAGYLVAKNKLIRIALHNRKNTELDGYLFGPTAVALAGEEVVSVAKILEAFAKKTPALKLKAGYADGQALDEAGVKVLASLPSKQELYGQLVGVVSGPARKLAVGLNDMLARVARCLDGRAKQLGE